jgi:hypothetical protein
LIDTLTWAEILVKTTFLGTPTLTVPTSTSIRSLKIGFGTRREMPRVEDVTMMINFQSHNVYKDGKKQP